MDPFTLETLLTSGYWPGSPVSINYLIKEEVFMLWDAFRKRMPGSSERAFLTSLCDVGYEYGRVRTFTYSTVHLININYA